jgi:SNF2 family DNA or RNA helicase
MIYRIYLPDPQAFFDVFKGLKSSASTAAATFFGKKNANRKPKLAALPEAAFNLLQWAQYGETFDFERRNHEANDNTSSDAEDENMIEQNEDELNGEGEKMGDAEKIPTWAKSVVDDTSGHGKALAECDGPKGLNVQLRPYQRQALQWMTEREAESDSQELTEQLELLAELSPNRAVAKSPPGDTRIHCECGPVVVADEVASTCTTVSGETKTASHPLWEKRYLASHDLSVAKCFYVQPLFGVGTSHPPRPPQPCRGGILADSMGLGKTMMLLALIGKSKEEDGDEARNKSTLVVGPLSLLTQWQEEIETKTNLTCRVYYGDKKSDDYTGADVVLTTCK